MRDPLPHQPALLVASVFLLVLVEQNQQVNVLSSLEVQVQIAVAAALSLATPRIRDARFSHTAKAWNHRAPVRPLQKLFLNRAQQFGSNAAGELIKPPRKCWGLDKLHNVIVPQCGMTWQVVVGGGGSRAAWMAHFDAGWHLRVPHPSLFFEGWVFRFLSGGA